MKSLMVLPALLGTAFAASAQRYDDVDRKERSERRACQSGEWQRGGGVRTFEAPRLAGFPLDIGPRDVGLDGVPRGRRSSLPTGAVPATLMGDRN